MSKSDLIVDIEDTSVGACLIERGETGREGKCTVNRVPFKNAEGAAAGAAPAAAALKEALAQFPKAMPTQTDVVLSPPWYTARAEIIEAKSEKPLSISKTTVAQAVHKHRAENPGVGGLESVVTGTLVNGYPTKLKNTVEGVSLKIHWYASDVEAQTLKTFQQTILEALPKTHVAFHTSPLSIFSALRLFREEKGFIFFNVRAETTEVGISYQGGLSFVGSFPRGSASFMRELFNDKSQADAASRLALFARGELSEESRAAFTLLFDKAAEEWNAEREKAVLSARIAGPVPKTIFVAGLVDELPWLQKVLEASPDPLRSRVLQLSSETLSALNNAGAAGEIPHDPVLGLYSGFFHTRPGGISKDFISV